jgi:hypothetical protein
MPRTTIGTEPVQVAWRNTKRFSLLAEFIPSSLIAGNTGIIYGKFGSAPKADAASNTWDFILNPGASNGANTSETQKQASEVRDLWLISDTEGQIMNVVEHNVEDVVV